MIVRLLFLFAFGSVCGWLIEVVYRSVISRKQLVNPGLLAGPWLPLYGFCAILLYFISLPRLPAGLQLVFFGLSTTLIELLAGYLLEQLFKLRLWDYSTRRWNLFGLVCPEFSLYWTGLSWLFSRYALPALVRTAERVGHSSVSLFCLGLVYGLILQDVAHAFNFALRIRQIAQRAHMTKLPHLPKLADWRRFLPGGFSVNHGLLSMQVRQIARDRRSSSLFMRFLNPFFSFKVAELEQAISSQQKKGDNGGNPAGVS